MTQVRIAICVYLLLACLKFVSRIGQSMQHILACCSSIYSIAETCIIRFQMIHRNHSRSFKHACGSHESLCDSSDVMIFLREITAENWDIRGGQAACDVELDSKIDVQCHNKVMYSDYKKHQPHLILHLAAGNFTTLGENRLRIVKKIDQSKLLV